MMELKSWKASPQHLLYVGMMVVVALIIFYSFTGAQMDEGYIDEIREFRRKKDERFKYEQESPLDKAMRDKFTTLSYFPVSPAYRITADIEWLPEEPPFSLPTTKEGEGQEYVRAAKARFRLEGQMHELLLLKTNSRPGDRLYLYFKDVTSGKETYGGGRYVEVEAKKAITCVIDFNMAYNPYCAYNPYYVCPLPPPENTLPIAIQAGEMNFVGK